MTNREKYKDEIINIIRDKGSCCYFLGNYVLPCAGKKCVDMECEACQVLFSIWLDEEHKKEEVDWSKVEVDTKIRVSQDGKSWSNRYFAKYEDGRLYAFDGGATSWSSRTKQHAKYSFWPYAELIEENK